MDNIFQINHNSNKEEVVIETVHALEFMLKEAKAGRIKSFAGVTLDSDNLMNNIIVGDIKPNYLSFMGMLADLKIEIKDNYEY